MHSLWITAIMHSTVDFSQHSSSRSFHFLEPVHTIWTSSIVDHDDQRRTPSITSGSFFPVTHLIRKVANLQNLNVGLISEFGQYKFLTKGDKINALLGVTIARKVLPHPQGIKGSVHNLLNKGLFYMIRFARTRCEAGLLIWCTEINYGARVSKKLHYFLIIVNCKWKVVQAAIIIFLNYEIFSTTFEFC